jgi:hypothetical protein
MPPRTEAIATIAQNWLTQFDAALARPDDVLLKTLFHADSYWRDLLAFTWRIRTVNGADAILRGLRAHVGSARPAAFRIDPRRAAPRHVTRAGTDAIEAIFTFETAQGRGNGVLRLTPDVGYGNTLKAWTCSQRSMKSRGTKSSSGDHVPRTRSTRAIFKAPTGSTSGKPLPSMSTANRPSSLSAEVKQGFRLQLASLNCRSTR